MRILILSDIHANLEALKSVIEDAAAKYDRVVCCGDLVGYNSDPGPVVDWVRENCHDAIRGNHDKVIAGIDDLDWFNATAQISARWTQTRLEPSQMDYLRNLAQGPLQMDGYQLCHGAPFDEDEYLLSSDTASEAFSYVQLPVTFFGHSHVQGGFFEKRRRIGELPTVRRDETSLTIELEADTLYLINPGSVGQPRDRDPRAAYAIFDTDLRTVQFRRVAYPIEQTYSKIVSAGLPDALGLRLFGGQ